MRLVALDTATRLEDIDLPGFRLHPLKGKMQGLWSIDVSKNWRITFDFQKGDVYVVNYEPLGISYRTVAAKLKVAPSTFNRLIKGQSNISSEMALRLSKTLGRTPESWLIMQNNYNLWQAKQTINLDEVEEMVIA